MGPKAVKATEVIVEALIDRSELVRESATASLESVNPKLYRPVMAILLDVDPRNVQLALGEVKAMGGDGGPVAPLLIAHLRSGGYAGTTKNLQNQGPRRRVRLQPRTVIECLEEISPESNDYGNLLLDITRLQRIPSGWVVAPDERRLVIGLVTKKVKAGLIEPKRAVSAFMDALADQNTTVDVIDGLVSIGSPAKAAVPVLRQLKLHSRQAVRDAASDAIERIEASQ